MKKTKLFTSLAALALVLSLGACGGAGDEDTTTGDESDSTSQTTEESGGSESEPTAYALVGDFVDADWDNEPAEDSKYYIAADATNYEITVEMGSAPEDTDDWAEWGPWNAGLRVVEYGTWNLVAGYGQLDAASTGVLGEGSDNNVGVNWNATYDLTITLGENPSILVTLVDDGGPNVTPVSTPDELISLVGEEKNYSMEVTYEYWVGVNTISLQDYLAIGMGTATDEQKAKYDQCWDGMTLDTYLVVDYYISEDYVLAYTYTTDGEEKEPSKVDLLLNYETGIYWSYSYDVTNDEWDTVSKDGSWEDNYSSLLNGVDYEGDAIFEYEAEGTYDEVSSTTWALNSDAKEAGVTTTLFENLGAFVETNSTKDKFKYRSTSFIEDYQEMITEFYYELFKTKSSDYYLTIEDIYFDVFNVGTTNQSETVTAIDAYLQSYIS